MGDSALYRWSVAVNRRSANRWVPVRSYRGLPQPAWRLPIFSARMHRMVERVLLLTSNAWP